MERLLEVYGQAVPAWQYLYLESLHESLRQRHLRRAQGMWSNYTYVLAAMGQVEHAVEIIERGQARQLAEAVRGQEMLRSVQEPQVQDAWRSVREAESRYRHSPEDRKSETESELAWARRRYYRLLKEHFPEYFAEPCLADIRNIAHHIPLVYLIATPASGLALVVTGEEVKTVWLEGLTEQEVRDQVSGPGKEWGGYLGAYFRWRESHRPGTSPQEKAEATRAWMNALEETTRWLWDAGMGRVVEVLRALTPTGSEGAILIPTGWLGLLPLHAAWTENPTRPNGRRYALDEVAFRYAPSATALREAAETAARVTEPFALLAVDDPDGSLPTSRYEVQAAIHLFPHHSHLRHEEATHSAVREALPRHTVAYFSTHGEAGWLQPLQARLTLADKPITLAEILDLHLPPQRLAVLSACETGIFDLRLAEEVVGLPAGLLQAGFAGVIASLWAVSAVSTAMLMARFFELWREEGMALWEALRQAQVWLRDSTAGDLTDPFAQMLDLMPATKQWPREVVEAFYDEVALRDPQARPFAHPYYWAGFGYTGV